MLYVSPDSPLSAKARRNLEAVLAGYDREKIRLSICDVSEDPFRAEADRIVYTPTLVLQQPESPAGWWETWRTPRQSRTCFG